MDGETPCQNPAGTPVLRAVWVPRESVTIVDTWSVMGMRGTGSQDFTVDDVFVPAARSVLSEDPPAETGPLFNQRAWYVHVWTPSAEFPVYLFKFIDCLLMECKIVSDRFCRVVS